MKVYVSEKDIEENDLNFIEDEFVEKYWLLRGDKFEYESGFEVHDDVGMVEIEALDQHDLEIRADERKKVLDKVLEFIEDRNERAEKGFDNTRFIKQEELKVIKQKLTELKGE